MSKKGIYWFTTDLRLDDNPALKMAAEAMDQLLFVYSVDIPVRLSHLQVGPSISQNRQVFLSESLHCLNEQLQDLGQHLVVIENTQPEMARLIDDHGITHIYRNSDQHALDSADWLKIQTHYPQINFSEVSNNRLFRLDQFPFELGELPDSFSKFRRKAEKLQIDSPLSPPNHLPTPITDPLPWPQLGQSSEVQTLFKGCLLYTSQSPRD